MPNGRNSVYFLFVKRYYACESVFASLVNYGMGGKVMEQNKNYQNDQNKKNQNDQNKNSRNDQNKKQNQDQNRKNDNNNY